MKKEIIKIKLDKVLTRLGMDTKDWIETISHFRAKLDLLSEAGNYNKLLKALFASNDLSEFNSYVFEVMFAYDFEIKQQPLIYEISQLASEKSSIDFCYKSDDVKILFELRLVQQRNWITESMSQQLQENKFYQILLNGNDEANETVRLQNLILQKCQNEEGEPIKFFEVKNGLFNFIVLNISELHLTGIDKADCFLTMYGDANVPDIFRRGIFGMWQELPENFSEIEKSCYDKFEYFRETIHGVLFVRYVKGSGHMSKMYIDRELEYFAVLNNNLLSKNIANNIIGKLALFLREWPIKKKLNQITSG